MNIRQLQYFLVAAEEENFSRSADRVHIHQSALSRAIKDLEAELGVSLFERGKGRTRLTWPGKVFREDAQRLLSFLSSVRARTKAAELGYRGYLRIALTDGLAQPRMTDLLAKCRAEEPLTEIRLVEMTVREMRQALNSEQIDAGFTIHDDFDDFDLVKHPVWADRLVLAIPSHHPLVVRDKVPLSEAVRHPMIVCHPERCEGGHNLLSRIFRSAQLPDPIAAAYVSGHELTMMFVAAGYGIGLALESQVSIFSHPNIVFREIRDEPMEASTYLVRPNRTPSPELMRFIERTSTHHSLSD
ncbi:LysR family transcriptional regulator [Pseudomonas aeruginosa]|uniref:LysR family transcriptional regulator n=1 Tax=Pseudomonas aeruginosa TaxID=287 RepID=UPI00106755FD|nr:LysR family transcriptional regulator [Pseudomonas aeruginosa]TEP82034.1 LysR family transcriptional regulator [Pseudomonas aeruginosa]